MFFFFSIWVSLVIIPFLKTNLLQGFHFYEGRMKVFRRNETEFKEKVDILRAVKYNIIWFLYVRATKLFK